MRCYDRGRRDSLRAALATLGAEEDKRADLLGESRSWRTNATREVRHKTLQVAETCVRTALNRLWPKDKCQYWGLVTAAIDAIGL